MPEKGVSSLLLSPRRALDRAFRGSRAALSLIFLRDSPRIFARGEILGIANCYCRKKFWASGALSNHVCMPEIKQKQPQSRKTVSETLSLPVAKILSPVARQAPTKPRRLPRLDGENRQSPIASVQRSQVNSHKPFCSSTWDKYYTNERQSRDSNRSATNAGSTSTKFCVFRGQYDRQRTLVFRIAAVTLASYSAITIARFRPSKLPRNSPRDSFLTF